nr:MAG TPA: hypothetical protein [Caudoviricetes sp.]
MVAGGACGRARCWRDGGEWVCARTPHPLPSHMLRFSRCEFLASCRGKAVVRASGRTPILPIRLPSDSGRVHY